MPRVSRHPSSFFGHRNECGVTKEIPPHPVRMMSAFFFSTLLLALLTNTSAQAEKMPRLRGGYIFDNKITVYTDENADGYRALLAIEPSSGEGDAPLTHMTFYPEPDTSPGLAVSLPAHSAIMFHANIPLSP